MDTPKPPIRGKYSIRSPAVNFLFRCLDAALSVCIPRRPSARPGLPPQRILISDIAHLGDVLMATSVLPVLQSAYPEARISFLVGSWSLPVLQNHPLVDKIHVLDHWAHNRASISRRAKFQQYLQTRRNALREIKAARYDIAFDLYWNFPNTLPLLWQAKIPRRVGYESGGFGPLATDCLEFGDKRLHAAQRFLNLVKTLPLTESDEAKLATVLPPLEAQDPGELQGRDYLVFHVGAADSFREWATPHWRELAQQFIAQGHRIVFTGVGDRDQAQIAQIMEGLDGCVNLCNRLKWAGFVAAIARARLLVCVDTVAGHVAAAVGTPCAVITAGRWPYLWRPLSQHARIVMHSVPCAPCHRNTGCDGMECLRNVTVADVYQAGLALLNESPLSFSE